MNWEKSTLYAVAAEMLLHKNGNYINLGKLKLSLKVFCHRFFGLTVPHQFYVWKQ